MFLHSEEFKSSDEDTLKEKVKAWLNTDGMEFVGFVEIYTRDETQRKEVLSFQVSAFLMYHRVVTNLKEDKSTKIEAALASREMQNSSALERLIQIVQVLHILKFKESSFWFEVNNEKKTSEAIVAMTILGMGSKRGKNTTTLSIHNPNIIAMADYNFAVA